MNRIYLSGVSHHRMIGAAAFCMLLFLVLASCGKKGTPSPPRQLPPPAVGDLTMGRTDDSLTLTWTVPKGKKRVISGYAGFLVYRSKQAVSEKECKGCPILFARVGDVPIENETPGDPVTFSETLEKGYRYIYKVTVYSTSGLFSGDSNMVRFTY